jgi:hypothetical protein
MKTHQAEYIPIETLLSPYEHTLFQEQTEHKLDLGNAAIHLFHATDVASMIENTIGGEIGKNMALKVCGIPEHVYVRV